MRFTTFAMERWQSTYEHRVRFNLSESGVHPMTVGELLEIAGLDGLDDVLLGYGQSNGSDALRAAIAGLYPNATDDSVLVTVGGAEANFAACWQLMDADASAAVMMPNYMQIPGILESFGNRILPFHLREDAGWQPDLDQLSEALEQGARFILVTNPNNPTGIAL
jgi:aspartate/methionine/tyrosine aminotransferase